MGNLGIKGDVDRRSDLPKRGSFLFFKKVFLLLFEIIISIRAVPRMPWKILTEK